MPYPKTVIALSKEARAAVDKAMASRGETWDTYSSRGAAPHVISENVVKRAKGMVADSRRLSRFGTGETPEAAMPPPTTPLDDAVARTPGAFLPETSKLLGRSVMNTAVGSQRADLDIALNLFASGDERSEMRRRGFLNAGQARPARRFRSALPQARERIAAEAADRPGGAPYGVGESDEERVTLEQTGMGAWSGGAPYGVGESDEERVTLGQTGMGARPGGAPPPPPAGPYGPMSRERPYYSAGPAPSAGSYGLMSREWPYYSAGPAPSAGSYGPMPREWPYYSAGPASGETPRANPYRLPARLTDFASESHAPVNGVPVMFAPDKAKREWLEDLDARRRASFERWYRGVRQVENGIDDFNAIVAAAGGAVGVIGGGASAAGAGGGARFSPNPNWYATHRTPQRVLDRIDAARKAAGVNTHPLSGLGPEIPRRGGPQRRYAEKAEGPARTLAEGRGS